MDFTSVIVSLEPTHLSMSSLFKWPFGGYISVYPAIVLLLIVLFGIVVSIGNYDLDMIVSHS